MTTLEAALIVFAKEPSPGQVKTRLCPPCTPEQAAVLAAAALADTLKAAAATAAARHVLVLDGEAGPWLPPNFSVISQGTGGLADRLGAAFNAVGAPALLVGMDTPQVTPALLSDALKTLSRPRTDGVLGFADDGGYWAIGLTDPTAPVFEGVPMSARDTGRLQLSSMRRHGLRVSFLTRLRDVDHFRDAEAVAALAPSTRFAAAFAALNQPIVAV